MTVIEPSSVTYPVIQGSIKVVFTWKLQPNKSYVLEVTRDGVSYKTVEKFTATPSVRTHSHTVDPVNGPLWPRLSEE